MSEKRFLETLQALLTMVNPNSATSVACVKATLENLFALARESDKCDGITVRLIGNATMRVDELIYHRDDFVSKKGDTNGNRARRNQLRLMLIPSC